MNKMTPLDDAEEFSGLDVALLIDGTEPSTATEADKMRVKPYLEALEASYLQDLQGVRDGTPVEEFSAHCLGSVISALIYTEDISRHHLDDPSCMNFNNQKFRRQEIRRWLDATGRPSAYAFDSPPTKNEEEKKIEQNANAPTEKTDTGPWPWGSYTTKNLEALASAVQEFWIPYVNGERKQPVNKNVMAYLVGIGVTTNMATAIATIIRQEGLPPGPLPIPEDIKNS